MGKPFSAILTGVGVVSLAGIVVNHNIILLSSYNHLRREHPELDYVALIVRAGAQRVRPVMLTTIVTVLGLLPMAFNMSVDFVNRSIVFGSQMSLFWVPLSQAIVWGLTFATVLTLVCTPAMLALPHIMKQPVHATGRGVAETHRAAGGARGVIRQFLDWYMGALESGGYPLIAGLMALESSIVPLPSEVVIPPAAHLAYTGGNMTLTGIVIAGTVGSWFGATVMYWGARLIGRPLLMKYGRYVLLPQQKIEAAEAWSDRFGAPGVFISRLLPVIRHLIGLPAGIVRMHYGWYSLATLVGSAIWSRGVVLGRGHGGTGRGVDAGKPVADHVVAGRGRRGAGRDVLLLRTQAHAPPLDLNERFNRTGSNAPPASVDALPVRASPECRRAPDRQARSRDTTVPVVRLYRPAMPL